MDAHVLVGDALGLILHPRLRRFIFGLTALTLSLLASASSAVSTTGPMAAFTDPTDNQFDVGNWLLNKRGFIVNPIVITEPAVGYGGGAALLFFHGNETDEEREKAQEAAEQGQSEGAGEVLGLPPSVSFGMGGYTETETWMAAGGHFGSFLEDRLRYTGAAGYASLNIDFYIGDIDVGYSLESPFVFQQLLVRLASTDLFLGGRYVWGRLESDFDFGVDLPSFIPDSLTFDLSGLGPVLRYDSRDNLFTANSGVEVEIVPLFYTQTLGSDGTYQALSTQLRGYWQAHERVVLAARVDTATSFGDTPFFALPTVQQRGVPITRYQNEYTVSSEVQARWRVWKRWSLIGFAGLGWAGGDINGLDDSKLVPSGGGGFRYLMARVLNLQMGMDFAGSDGEFAFYFQIGTGF
jgi:hypothetical protein